MKKLNVFVFSVLFSAWVLLIFHTHPAHLSDLHPSHAECQICAHSARVSHEVLPVGASAVLPLPIKSKGDLFLEKIFFVLTPFHSVNSRSPPL